MRRVLAAVTAVLLLCSSAGTHPAAAAQTPRGATHAASIVIGLGGTNATAPVTVGAVPA